MKKSFLSGIFIMILLIATQIVIAAEARVVRVGAFDDPPLLFLDTDGLFKGLYADLLADIGKKENITFEYVFGTWQEGLDRIKTGEVDMLTDVGFTDERATYMDYCKSSLLTFWGEIYVLKSSEIFGLLDITEKKIGVLKGDIFNKNFQDLIKKFSINCEIIELESYDEVFKAISEKRVEVGVAPGSFKAKEQKKYGVKATGFVFSPLDVFFVTAKGKNLDLRNILDAHLDEWKHQNVSVFSLAKQKWLYGDAAVLVVMPPWLVNLLIILAIAIAIAVGFILMLQLQVKNVTAKIRLREKALKESEKNFRTMVETIPMAIHLTSGIEQKTEYINPAMVKLFGYTNEDLPSVAQWWPLAYPDENYRRQISEEWNARVRKAIETKLPIEPIETVDNCKDGSKKNILWGFTPMGDKNYSFGLDLTVRKAAENKTLSLLAEKELLLKEVHHRIKNNMTTIKGLITLQIASEKNSSAIASLQDAESRVQSIIVLYDRLYCTDNYRELSLKDYLEPLVEEIAGNFHSQLKVKLVKKIDDFILNVRILSPLGIIVNELLTNILKYAFTGKDSGLITVSASLNKNRATIGLQDNGIGISESISFENSTGFGMQLVRMLTEQIGGSIRIERGEGTKFVLEFSI